MELGGKNPNVVFADTDFETAVDCALTAAFLHSGQVCSAGARLIVEDALHDDLVAELAARAERIRLGDGLDPASECGPLVSAAHRAKIEDYVASAQAEGARLVAGGQRPDDPALQGRLLLPAHRLHGRARGRCAVVREETFGPILTVERFTTEEEAIALANDTDYGLAGAVWTGDGPGRSGWPPRCATAPCGSTTTTRTYPARSGAAWAAPATAASWARPGWPSTRSTSTSGTTPRPRRRGWFNRMNGSRSMTAVRRPGRRHQ